MTVTDLKVVLEIEALLRCPVALVKQRLPFRGFEKGQIYEVRDVDGRYWQISADRQRFTETPLGWRGGVLNLSR